MLSYVRLYLAVTISGTEYVSTYSTYNYFRVQIDDDDNVVVVDIVYVKNFVVILM